MKLKLAGGSIIPVMMVIVLASKPGLAWDKHQSLMPMILESPSPPLQEILERASSAPCSSPASSDDLKNNSSMIRTLVHDLNLNPAFDLPPAVAQGECSPRVPLKVADILKGSAVDDPDLGMDRNLPHTAENPFDPNDDRKWMGGYVGPTSQGFRHMYFGGWKIAHPLATFQIPLRPLGQAPLRAEIIANRARELIRSGNLIWGTRVLGWAMHYIQDLTQPFHSVQLPSLTFAAWGQLFQWPPGKAVEKLVQETTRIVANFHWAYEGYSLNRVLLNERSPFYDCLVHPEKYSQISFDPKTQGPRELALQMSQNSIQIATKVGASLSHFLDPALKKPGLSIADNPDYLNYDELANRPELANARQEVEKITCQAMANASLGSRALIEWAFQP